MKLSLNKKITILLIATYIFHTIFLFKNPSFIIGFIFVKGSYAYLINMVLLLTTLTTITLTFKNNRLHKKITNILFTILSVNTLITLITYRFIEDEILTFFIENSLIPLTDSYSLIFNITKIFALAFFLAILYLNNKE